MEAVGERQQTAQYDGAECVWQLSCGGRESKRFGFERHEVSFGEDLWDRRSKGFQELNSDATTGVLNVTPPISIRENAVVPAKKWSYI
ncbi:hypothetical protein GCM10022279_12030 [Comamonas faecalis]|uniref:Uncharacterized protein n=1 Tax=Comamonas faecalis TaxID=1387849 RepID=A0ABP7QZR7_9BURK